jgi:hypothetical protein
MPSRTGECQRCAALFLTKGSAPTQTGTWPRCYRSRDIEGHASWREVMQMS